MALLSPYLRSVDSGVAYYCPGCKTRHVINLHNPHKSRWVWDGNPAKPTLQPSVFYKTIRTDLTEAEQERYDIEFERVGPEQLLQGEFKHWCHHFLTDGKLIFLSDCTHHLAGQTVDLPPLETSNELE